MSKCRRLMTPQVITTERMPAPAASMPTAISCPEPAYTNRDIMVAAKGESPASLASTPKAKPTGTYPSTTGMAFLIPARVSMRMLKGITPEFKQSRPSRAVARISPGSRFL